MENKSGSMKEKCFHRNMILKEQLIKKIIKTKNRSSNIHQGLPCYD